MSNHKILLIKPLEKYPARGGIYNKRWPPLALMNCASLLEKEGHSVTIMDAHAHRTPLHDLVAPSVQHDKVFIISSELDRWECPGMNIDAFLDTCRAVVQYNADLYVLGVHGTLQPKNVIEQSGARAVIMGEPENVVLDLCKNQQWRNVNGIAYLEDSLLKINPSQASLDLKDLPIPAFHLLDMSKYWYEFLPRKNFAIFEGSRGCPWKCTFCMRIMFGDEIRNKSAEQLIIELEVAINKYGVRTAQFIDLEFTSNREVYDKVCEYLIEKDYDFEWCCQARVDKLSPELLLKMKKAGCRLILCGIETGSQQIMDDIKKNLPLSKVAQIIAGVKKLGIEVACFFMLGFPNETKSDMLQTIKFAIEIDPSYVSFHEMIPFEATGMIKHKDKLHTDTAKGMRRLGYLMFYIRFKYILSAIMNNSPSGIFHKLRLFIGFLR